MRIPVGAVKQRNLPTVYSKLPGFPLTDSDREASHIKEETGNPEVIEKGIENRKKVESNRNKRKILEKGIRK